MNQNCKRKKLIILGASGHGKVVAEIALLNGYRDIVFLDDDESIEECAGFPVVGTTKEVKNIDGDRFVAIGDSSVRERLQHEIETVTLIHPNSVISRRVSIGKGTVVMPGAVINSDTVIGEGCIVNTLASIDHDCEVADYCHIAVGAHLCGTVKIQKGVWIGAGATVCNNIEICCSSTVGAGAVVVSNIVSAGTYVGVPAKRISERC